MFESSAISDAKGGEKAKHRSIRGRMRQCVLNVAFLTGTGLSIFLFVETLLKDVTLWHVILASSFLLFFVGLGALIIVATWKVEGQRRQEEEAFRRYVAWTCPDCRQPFGPDVWIVPYGSDHEMKISASNDQYVPEFRGRIFVQWVGLVCPHCRTLNFYNPEGRHLWVCGAPWSLEFPKPIERQS